jgi:hypothetical protein
MAKIVLNEEPKRIWQCPFGKAEIRCERSKNICFCVRDVSRDDNGQIKNLNYIIDFERCPYCTTFEKEYVKVLREGEM